MQFSKSILIAAVAVLSPLASQASSVTSNPTLSVAGLTFNDFSCSMTKGGIFATPNSCGKINVNTITSPGNGIQISSGFNAALGSFDDAVINYSVSSNAPINTVGLDFNGTFEGMAISSVTETVFSGGRQVGFAQVSCSTFGCSRTDTISLDGPYSSLNIQKDIYVGAALGVAQTSIIDQTFGTDAAPTPEPSSMALFGSGLIGAAMLFRRKSGKKAETLA